MSIDSEVRNAIQGAFCSAVDSYDKAAGAAGKALAGYTLAGKAANAARSMFCDEPPFEQPDSVFAGGQCETVYRISGFGTYFSSYFDERREAGFTQTLVKGPISNPQITEIENVIRWYVDAYNRNTGLLQTFRLGAVTASFGTVSEGEFGDIVIKREDNQPDSCGNPDYTPPAHPPGGLTTPITINNNTGTLNIGEFIIDNSGGLRVPVTVDLPDFPLIGELNLGKGEINIGFGGGGGGGDSPNNVLKPDDEPLNPDEPADEATAVSNIVGVLVVVSSLDSTNKATSIFQSGVPNIYAPRLGNVNFKYRTGSKITWSSDLRVKNFNNFIPNPSGYGAIDVVVNADEGVTYQAFAVRGVSPIDVVEV